jgi:SAM-dependent methyltransferase
LTLQGAVTGAFEALLETACKPYRRAGRFAYFFARGKLSRDPVYRAILKHGLLEGRLRILDLGCGQGLLSAWIRAAQRGCAVGAWPCGWPPAPQAASIRGLELMSKDVQRAHVALGAACDIVQADIRYAEFGAADAVVLFDVLHYMQWDEQRAVLERVRAALPAGGLLLLRVGDAGAGWRFHYTESVDKVVMFLRGHSLIATHCRTVTAWRELLRACGFDSEIQPMSRGTPFANVLLVAVKIDVRRTGSRP